MSDIFRDKKYDEMDWLSAATRPIIDPLNDLLVSIPNEIEVTYDKIESGIETYRYIPSMSVRDMLSPYVTHGLSWEEIRTLCECFDMVLEGKPRIDVDNKKIINGKIKVIKIKEYFEEDESSSRIGLKTIRVINGIHHKEAIKDNVNEILDLLGLNEARSFRSVKQKCLALQLELANIMRENKWNIMDIPLSNRIGTWVVAYITDNNLAALSNFCKLKVMTHEDLPIYSIEEELEL